MHRIVASPRVETLSICDVALLMVVLVIAELARHAFRLAVVHVLPLGVMTINAKSNA